MCPVEEFVPEPDRELGPLIRALEPYGGEFTFTSWASVPGAVTVHLYLPEDEYSEKMCRQLIKAWRVGPLPEPP